MYNIKMDSFFVNLSCFHRSYMSFDILRRVMSDYFGYDVFYVMNITDIDDKIIKRARQKFLYEKYVEENRSPTEVLRDAREASRILEITVKTASDESKKSLLGNILSKMIKAVEDLGKAVAEKDEKMVAETQGVSQPRHTCLSTFFKLFFYIKC